MRHISAVCLFVALGLSSVKVKAQGDSDPGFTTTGAMRNASALMLNDDEYENQKAHVSLGHAFAKGERDARLNISQIEARLPLFGMFSGGYFDLKLPVFANGGELANTWGLGDLNATYTHMFLGIENWTIQGTAGLKIGMGTANVTDGQTRPLPMSYQASMGSTDVIVGGSVTWKRYVTAAVGYQQPVFRYNENDYFAAYKINDTLYSRGVYPIARKLYRQGDVMARLEGHYYTGRVGITAGGTAIYHLRNDLYEDRNTNGWYEIEGSKGLTVNIVGNVFARFGRYNQFKLDGTVAFPVVRRDVIPDGSYRQWTAMPRFTYFFGTRKGSPLF